MTAKAIPPPNPMQSLRARLIQEGSIIPRQENTAIDELVDRIESSINRLFVFNKNKIRRKISEYKKIFSKLEELLSKYYLGSQISGCRYASLLNFLNLHKNLKNSFKNQNNDFRSFLVLRDGFFFAFKENMRNTP